MPSPVPSLASDPLPPESDSQAVLDSIRQIVHALELGSRAAQKTVGLSGAQLFVLQTLAAATSLSVNELATASRTHQSSVSVVVSRLVEAGFVRRSRSARDARRVELSVTPAGRRLLKAEFVTPQQRLLAALERLPARRLADLRSLLAEVVSASGMELQKIPMFFEKVSSEKPEAKSNKTNK
jgi:DNA-binding MarR family transcriptional regulator